MYILGMLRYIMSTEACRILDRERCLSIDSGLVSGAAGAYSSSDLECYQSVTRRIEEPDERLDPEPRAARLTLRGLSSLPCVDTT